MRRRPRFRRTKGQNSLPGLARAALGSVRSSPLPRDNRCSPPPRPSFRGNDPYGRAAVVSRPPGRRTAPLKLARLLRCLPLLLTVLPLLPPVVHAQNYPRIAYYGALKRSGEPVMDDAGNLIDSVANAMARYPEVIIDMDPITPYRPQFLTSMRQRNPSVKLLAYVTGHYIWSSLDPDSLNHYPTRYWRMVRDMDGFLYNKSGAQFGLTNHAFANVNLAKKAQGRYVVAESLATLFWDFAVRRGGWDGIFVDT